MGSHVSCSPVCQIASARVSDCLGPSQLGEGFVGALRLSSSFSPLRAQSPSRLRGVTTDPNLETRSTCPGLADLCGVPVMVTGKLITDWQGPQASLERLLGVDWQCFLLWGVRGNVLLCTDSQACLQTGETGLRVSDRTWESTKCLEEQRAAPSSAPPTRTSWKLSPVLIATE